MSDLISRSDVISVLEQLEEHSLTGKMDISNAIYLLNNTPTAYDIDNVIEELEEMIHPKQLYFCKYARGGCKHLYNNDKDCMECIVENAIEIVKQGVMANNRKDCEYRHDNGNCLKVGGFCTAVDNKHCEKLKRGGVADDVCEWKIFDNSLTDKPQWVYKTTCGKYIEEEHTLKEFVYCPYCGRKIKVVE